MHNLKITDCIPSRPTYVAMLLLLALAGAGGHPGGVAPTHPPLRGGLLTGRAAVHEGPRERVGHCRLQSRLSSTTAFI